MRTRFWNSRAAVAALLCALAAIPVFAVPGTEPTPSVAGLPENWEARVALRETISAPVRRAASRKRVIVDQPETGFKVAFQADVQDGALYLVFANPKDGAYPLAGMGTFIIKRNLKDGRFIHAKVFVQDDPGCYLRLYPLVSSEESRTRMDIYLFGQPYQMHIVLPAPFENLLVSPVSRIIELSRDSVDWDRVLPPEVTAADQRLARIVKTIRAKLAKIPDAEDGAMDGAGRLAFIKDGSVAPRGKGGLNCSGFAKWVIDGFYQPITGKCTDIAALKERSLDERGNSWSASQEQTRDPYFGLDWTRNLARALAEARTGTLPGVEDLDVRNVPRFTYIRNVGHSIESLRPVLYSLARGTPGTIYLGSVNSQLANAGVDGNAQPLRQHHHVIVLFPYFEKNGVFQVVVMERHAETSLSSLSKRYPADYVHLVAIPSDGEFILPLIE